MLAKEEFLLIIYFVVVILLLTTFTIVFFITYQKRKNKLLLEKYEAEKRFEDEIVKSKLEIQEQTLKNVGWELHDNIGQLLSVASMQLNILSKSIDNKSTMAVSDIKEVVASSLQEVRSLSKSLNSEVIQFSGLEESVKNELSRFERLQVIEPVFRLQGDGFDLDQKDTIILYRILQELFSNVIKHSKASKLEVTFDYSRESLKIIVKDNGVGFNMNKINRGSGMFNLESRAKLINSDLNIESSINNGTIVTLIYPTEIHEFE